MDLKKKIISSPLKATRHNFLVKLVDQLMMKFDHKRNFMVQVNQFVEPWPNFICETCENVVTKKIAAVSLTLHSVLHRLK